MLIYTIYFIIFQAVSSKISLRNSYLPGSPRALYSSGHQDFAKSQGNLPASNLWMKMSPSPSLTWPLPRNSMWALEGCETFAKLGWRYGVTDGYWVTEPRMTPTLRGSIRHWIVRAVPCCGFNHEPPHSLWFPSMMKIPALPFARGWRLDPIPRDLQRGFGSVMYVVSKVPISL